MSITAQLPLDLVSQTAGILKAVLHQRYPLAMHCQQKKQLLTLWTHSSFSSNIKMSSAIHLNRSGVILSADF